MIYAALKLTKLNFAKQFNSLLMFFNFLFFKLKNYLFFYKK